MKRAVAHILALSVLALVVYDAYALAHLFLN